MTREHDSWEPEANQTDASEPVAKYMNFKHMKSLGRDSSDKLQIHHKGDQRHIQTKAGSASCRFFEVRAQLITPHRLMAGYLAAERWLQRSGVLCTPAAAAAGSRVLQRQLHLPPASDHTPRADAAGGATPPATWQARAPTRSPPISADSPASAATAGTAVKALCAAATDVAATRTPTTGFTVAATDAAAAAVTDARTAATAFTAASAAAAVSAPAVSTPAEAAVRPAAELGASGTSAGVESARQQSARRQPRPDAEQGGAGRGVQPGRLGVRPTGAARSFHCTLLKSQASTALC